MSLTLTRTDVQEFSRKNQYAMTMFMTAGCDYFACRCCLLNGLWSGFRLASEAVEKLLKASIFLRTGTHSKLKRLKRSDLHNPYRLKEELKSARADPRLDGYDDLLRKLHDEYQKRYPDNEITGQGVSSQELAQIDALFLYLVEALPMPDKVKYRSAFFAFLCDEKARRCQNYHWAIAQNPLLQKKMPLFEAKYHQVEKHLYG